MKKLWGARFNQDSSVLMDVFNESLSVDVGLYRQDLRASREHARMLKDIKILSDFELKEIIDALDSIENEIENNEFDFTGEDIHMAVESALTAKLGEIGKKIHTARSRNDQVATDFKMYCLESSKEIISLLKNLISTLLLISKNHTNTLMPGMTHLQHAQPISFAFHLLSYVSNFKRDIQRLRDDIERNSDCPLGSAALAGSVYGNERVELAKRLGFKSACINAMDGVSSRDFALDLLYSVSMIFMHISRFAEELILWSSYEFKFISFSDSFSTGSSIMPQKKNPDVAELLRGKSGRGYGNLISLLTIMKSLPMAYNKDMQEDKECVFDSVKNIKISLQILNESLKEIIIHKDNMLKACEHGHLVATDLADFLVANFNIAFRDAYYLTGICIKELEKIQLDLSKCDVDFIIDILQRESLKELDFTANIKDELKNTLTLFNSMEKRNTLGGTATSSVQIQIDFFSKFIESLK